MPIDDLVVATRQAAVRVRQSKGAGAKDELCVVMLHGSGHSTEVFRRQFASSLSESHRLIAIDLPGHGLSGNANDPAAAYTLEGLTGTVEEVLAAVGCARAAVFGWSLGGHVALQLAATSSLVKGLFITGAPPVSLSPLGLLRGFNSSLNVLLATKETFSERDVERFERLCFGDAGTEMFRAMIRRSDGRVRANFVRSLMRGQGVDQRAFIERAAMPIAILNGEHDPFVRRAYLEKLKFANLWRGRCHLVPGTGHSPFWHAPDIFNPVLAAFLRDLESGEAAAPAVVSPARRYG
jgi:pimeloyl-ACP methyl ester carboxylesterase